MEAQVVKERFHTVQVHERYAERLANLAEARGISQAALIEEALALLFCASQDERDILRELFEETGPSTATIAPALSASDILQVIPVLSPKDLWSSQ